MIINVNITNDYEINCLTDLVKVKYGRDKS